MAKEYALSFYNSKAWIDCKEGYLQSQEYSCERCGEPAKIVHHKRYINSYNINDPEITLSWNNLEALCARCHQHEHFKNLASTRADLEFDEHGNLVRVEFNT